MLKKFRGDCMYQSCSICGSYIDDGTVRDGELICQECLDEKEKEESASSPFLLYSSLYSN